MAVITHPPYSLDSAPCDLFLFTKMKLNPKGRRFDTNEEFQVESQRVLDTLTENDFQEEFQKWRRRWDRYLPTCVRVMAAYRPYGEFDDFYSVSPEYFGYALVKGYAIAYLKNLLSVLTSNYLMTTL
jgi:hypothetical protein